MISVANGARRAALLAVVLATAPGAASAAPPEHKAIRLDYRLDAEAAGCPSERELRGLVAARLGFDPFDEGAPTRAQASIARQGERLRSELKLVDSSGRSLGARTLDSSLGSCAALAQSLALDLAIAVDPDVLARPAPPTPLAQPVPREEERTAPAPRPAGAPAPEERATSTASAPASFSVRLGALGATGLLPSSAPGISLEGAARWGAYSLALEGELFPSSTIDAAGGESASSLLRVGLRGCRHVDRFGLCFHGSGGIFHAQGQGLDNPRDGSSGAASLGPVGLVEWRPAERFAIEARVALDFALVRDSVVVGSVEEWRSPLLALVAGVNVGWIFP